MQQITDDRAIRFGLHFGPESGGKLEGELDVMPGVAQAGMPDNDRAPFVRLFQGGLSFL